MRGFVRLGASASRAIGSHGTVFPVGMATFLVVSEPGTLWLRVSDANLADNVGELR
jgi:hypothetical protein